MDGSGIRLMKKKQQQRSGSRRHSNCLSVQDETREIGIWENLTCLVICPATLDIEVVQELQEHGLLENLQKSKQTA